MTSNNRKRILSAHRELSYAEWGLRCMRGLVSEFPLVGGLMAEGISLAIEAQSGAKPDIQVTANDGLIAAGTFDPSGHRFIGHGLTSGTDHGAGHYGFCFAQSCEDYVVHAEINDATYNIIKKDELGFEIKVLTRGTGQPVDRPIKLAVFSSADPRKLFVG